MPEILFVIYKQLSKVSTETGLDFYRNLFMGCVMDIVVASTISRSRTYM